MMMKATNGKFPGYFLFYYGLIGKRLFVSLLLSVFVTLLDGVSLLLFLPLIKSSGNTKAMSSASNNGFINKLLSMFQQNRSSLSVNEILMLIAVLFAVKGGVKFVQLNYQVKVKHALIKRIRLRLYNKLNDISYRDFFSAKASYIHNTFTVEVQYLIQTINPFLGFIQSSVILITYFFLSFFISSKFALAAIVCLAVYYLFYKSVSRPVYKTSKTVTDKNKDFNNLLVQALRYFKYLKSTGRFHLFGKQMRQVINDTEAVNRKIGFNMSFSSSVKEPLIVGCIMTMIFFQLHYLQEGLDIIFINLLVLFRILSTSASAQNNWQSFYEHAGSIDAVSNLLVANTASEKDENKKLFSSLQNNIVFNDVTLSFHGKPVLNGINMTIPAKKMVAIVGKIGSGKTTLFNMVCGLLPPDKGSLLFDQVPVSALDKNSLQAKTGSISQDAVIFNDTLFNNITFWSEHTPDNLDKVWEIVELLSFKDFVLALPAKENSVIGDYGIQLSGGQKQLVNIARELYKNPDILLFDEATSALDAETAKQVQKSLNKLHGRYTILLIAHSVASIKKADIIYIIHEGKIIDSGNYCSLLDRSDFFKTMFGLQTVGS